MNACLCDDPSTPFPLRVGDVDTFGFRWNAPPVPWLAAGDTVASAVWTVDTPTILAKTGESLQPVGSTLVRLQALAEGFGSATVAMTTTLGDVKHATLYFQVSP